MSKRDVIFWENIHHLGGSYRPEHYWIMYARSYNKANPSRKISPRRLNWKQRARAITIGDMLDWYYIPL